ncbi:MAG: TonB-dependent receptor [Deltaproteobacteria bacterium]|nr:TonB-dependent receptor [Deltaproteobacteria bacterium]
MKLLTMVALSFVPCIASAIPDNEDYETVVTASRTPERSFDSPRAVEIVRGRDSRRRGASTSPEVLEEAVGVVVQRTNSAGGAPIVRGLLGQHVLLLVDGVRLNTAITRFGPNQLLNTVDPFQLARVEVLRGPGSVLYGSDAMGGVLNLITRKPHFDPWRAWDASGMALLRYVSAAEAPVLHAEAEGHLRSIGLRLGGSWRRFSDLHTALGKQNFSSYREGDFDASLAWYLTPESVLRASYAATRQHDAPRTDRSTPRDFGIFRDQLRDLAILSFRRKAASGVFRRVDARLSYQLQRELRERYRLDDDRLEREQDGVHAISALLSARSALPFNMISYGVEATHDRVRSSAEDETLSLGDVTQRPRGRYVEGSTMTRLGLFANDSFSALKRRLRIDGGVRLSSTFVDIPQIAAQPAVQASHLGIVGSLHGRYAITEGIRFIAGVGQGFRSPNVDDFSAIGCSGQGYDMSNPGLSPERSLSAEAGLKLDLFGVVEASTFYSFTHLDAVIVREIVAGEPLQLCGGVVPLPTTRRVNAQQARVHAVEGKLSLNLGRLRLLSWVAYSHGEVDLLGGGSEPLSRVPPLNGLFAIRYRIPGVFVEAALRWATAQRRLAATDEQDVRICPEGPVGCQGTDAFARLDLRGGFRLGKHLRAILSLENLSNSAYRWHGSGLDGPGISLRSTLEVLFR